MAQDYYSILGVSREASPQDIKKAFRAIARECHPDVAGTDPAAEERFKVARTAYETLMDPVTRARYDRRGQRARAPQPGGSFFDAFYRNVSGGGGGGPGKRKHGAGGAHAAGGHASSRGADKDPGNNLDLDDLFNDFGDFGFGRSRNGAKPPPSRPEPKPEPTPMQGADVIIEVEVPAATARDGGSTTAVYYRMQRADAWRPGASDPGVVRVQDIADIRIIPGTRDGEVLRERGLGDAGPHGGPYGDLVARVRVVGHAPPPKPPPETPKPPPPADTPRAATGEGTERVVDISVVEAMLGGRIDLTTPQGHVRLTLPPGTSSGARLRLKGKGPDGPDGPADLYVITRIVVPKHLDDESRRLIEEFARLNPGDPRES